MLDPTEQRIVGVLIEKELSVPDSYPMTENALLAGCNQKSNRDPEMSLELFQLQGALMALRESGWATRVEGGGRATKYKHCVESKLEVRAEKPIIAELLIRGPQAPGALKPRVARMGLVASPTELTDTLHRLASRPTGALVEQLPRRPRERDQRWRHLCGAAASEAPDVSDSIPEPSSPLPADAPMPIARPSPAEAVPPPAPDRLVERVERLEREVAELRSRLGQVERPSQID